MQYREFFEEEKVVPISDICLTDGVPNRTAFDFYTKGTLQASNTVTFLWLDISLAKDRKGERFATALLKYVASELPKELPAFRLTSSFFAVFAPEDNVRSVFAGNETVKAITTSVDTDTVENWDDEIEKAEEQLKTAYAIAHQSVRDIPEFFREKDGFLPTQLFWSASVRLTVKEETVTAYAFPIRFPEAESGNPMLPFVCVICHEDGRAIPIIADSAAHFGVKGERFFLSCFFQSQRGVGLQLLLEAESESTEFHAEFEYYPGRFVPSENGLHYGQTTIFPFKPCQNGLCDAILMENDCVTVTNEGKAVLDGIGYIISKDLTGYHIFKEG